MQIINKSPEARLMQLLNSKQVKSEGWVAIHFHLSELLAEYQSEYQVKIAINLIHDLLKNYEGAIVLLGDNSIIVLCNRLEAVVKEKLTFQLRYLYMDDPLAYTEGGQENPKFCTFYDLSRDWQDFFAMCSHRMVMSTRKPATPLAVERPAPKVVPAEPVGSEQPAEPVVSASSIPNEVTAPPRAIPQRGELSASKLAMIENTLRMADVQNAIRRQPVCAVLPDNKIRRVFDELYINIAHLRTMMKSDVDFLSNRWLFKYITHILDERMLALLRSKPGQFMDSPISINLNVETLLSSWFAEFDASISAANKVAIILEIPVMDVFVDMDAFLLARKEVQKQGYRVCLDGLSTASFVTINRGQLGVDLLKMQWNADSLSNLHSDGNKALVDAVQKAGTNRLILCRCDNKSAIEYGQELGISLYQGRYLDSLLNPTSKIEN